MILAKLFTQYNVIDLTREFAEKYETEMSELISTIPLVKYPKELVLSDMKDGRIRHGQWQHGVAVTMGDELIGVVTAYEREAEKNKQYPKNTLYICKIVIKKGHRGQGVGTGMLEAFFKKNDALGFIVLPGRLNYTVQATKADWNDYVMKFYEKLGFVGRAHKKYPEKLDIVYGRNKSLPKPFRYMLKDQPFNGNGWHDGKALYGLC